MRAKHRGEWKIILDILTVISEGGSEGIKKTRIIYTSNMSDSKQFSKYFNKLLDKSFVRKSNKDYYITKKGIDLMRKLREIERILE